MKAVNTYVAIVALTLGSGIAPGILSAQEQSPPAEQKKETDTVEAKKASTSETVKNTTAKATTKIKAKSAESADNYEASEEISEDLSVSYPVDI